MEYFEALKVIICPKSLVPPLLPSNIRAPGFRAFKLWDLHQRIQFSGFWPQIGRYTIGFPSSQAFRFRVPPPSLVLQHVDDRLWDFLAPMIA